MHNARWCGYGARSEVDCSNILYSSNRLVRRVDFVQQNQTTEDLTHRPRPHLAVNYSCMIGRLAGVDQKIRIVRHQNATGAPSEAPLIYILSGSQTAILGRRYIDAIST